MVFSTEFGETWPVAAAAVEYSNSVLDWPWFSPCNVCRCFCTFMSVLVYIKAYWRRMNFNDEIELMAAAVPASGEAPRGGSPKEPARVRMEFPETWLWSESRTGYHLTLAVVCAAALIR